MKMKLLSAAMLAGLGVAGTAQAVFVNPDGTGQVLLYPYYTVQNGYETYVHIVNTQDTTKAVKVRIREGMNSQEVLDFNLYLSPHDEWAGKIFHTTAGASLRTSDTSCISGKALPDDGQPFVNYEYSGDATAYKTTERAREGYIEVIEMGNITDPDMVANIAHGGPIGARVPLDCDAVRTASKNASHAINGGASNDFVTVPTGGLYGFASLIAVGSGLRTSYDAVALDNFFIGGLVGSINDLHALPGTSAPSLSDVDTVATIFNGGAIVQFDSLTYAIDNVSALLMHSAIMNDYVVDAGRNSSTNWIVTFPTKWDYVNGTRSTSAATRAPFYQAWNGSSSCDMIDMSYYDREESTEAVEGIDFSPQPPEGQKLGLCREVNTISLKRNGQGTTASLFGAVYTHNGVELAGGFDFGWMKMAFPTDDYSTTVNAYNGLLTDGSTTLSGLPVIGFAAFTSENTVGGGLSNYMGSTVHKSERIVND